MKFFGSRKNGRHLNTNTDKAGVKKTKKGARKIILRIFIVFFSLIAALSIFVLVFWHFFVTPPAQPEVIAAPSDDADRHAIDEEGFLIVDPDHYGSDDYDEYYESPLPAYNAPSWAVDRRKYFWTFLIVGLNEGTNANTVMVASYCGVEREANLISIPRDVPVSPSRNGRRISSSYIIGARNGGVAGGVTQMQRDVQTVIGFIPDFYIVIDYDSFFTIVDAVGGIDIYVPIRMRYDDPHQNLRIDIHPGLQHMDSATALNFARFRQSNRNSRYPGLPDGDLGRIRNQQAIISAVISELLTPSGLLRIPEFVGIFNESVHTNISFTDMLYFGNELNHIRRTDAGTDSISMYTFATRSGMANGISYQFLTPSNVVELINQTINPFDRDISAGDLRIIRS